MENNDDNYNTLKESVIDHYQNSELKCFIKYKETETIYPGNVERNINLSGRVNKSKLNDLTEFKEILYDIVAEKSGNQYATDFLNENFNVEIGMCEGDQFQGLDVFDTNGNKVNLKHQSGQVLMIDFWATWCGYCQQPMQENVDLFLKNTNLKDRNISIVGVSCDENSLSWKSHINEKKWTSLPQFIKTDILKQVGVRGIPCIAIINKKGLVAYFGHPNGLNLEATLLNLSEEKEIVRTGDELETDSNSWWQNLDTQSKMDIVAESNFLIKDSGVINANFCVTTKFTFDAQSMQVIPVKTTPIFYGDVTQFEYETIQNCAINLQTTYNFNGFSFNVRVMQIGADQDF